VGVHRRTIGHCAHVHEALRAGWWVRGSPFLPAPHFGVVTMHLPQQQVSATRLLHRDYLSRLEEVHRRVQAELAQNRATQNFDFPKTGFRSKDQETHRRAVAEFESLYQKSLLVAERLSNARVVVSREDSWLAQFGDGAVLEPVEVVVDGIDPVQLRSEISVLRAERTRILSAPAGADRARIGTWIDWNRREAEAAIERLISRYPHFLDAAAEHGVLVDLILTMFSRDEIVEALAGRIDQRAEGAMPVAERAGRLAAIDAELEALLRIDAALVDRAIGEGSTDVNHDRESAPWVLLGVAAQARAMQLAS
jgi:hypothetical protein